MNIKDFTDFSNTLRHKKTLSFNGDIIPGAYNTDFLNSTQLQRPRANKILLDLDKILNKHARDCNYFCGNINYDGGIWIDDHSYRQGDIYRYLFSHEEILDLANELREFANDGRTRKEVARVF